MDRKTFCIWLFLFSTFSVSFAQKTGVDAWVNPAIANPEQLDASSWNLKFLENDIKTFKKSKNPDGFPLTSFPLEVLPFPVVDYGFGSSGAGEFVIESPFKLSVSYFLVGKHDYNQEEFGPKETHVSFCNLIILSDTLDTENYGLIHNYVTSRNHPDYVGEGSVHLKNQNIDYVCFHKADHTSYAIIGTKLFNLEKGQTIIVAPYVDGSVRFLQVKTPRLTHLELTPYIKRLVQESPVVDFLQKAMY